MATAKPIASTPRHRRIRRRAVRLVLALAVLLIVLLAWFWRPLRSTALTDVSYGAHVGCACRYVEGRELGDCRDDFAPGMQLVRLSEDRTAKSVTASIPLVVHQTATFREGQGCVLEKWQP
jgi:hypothetical protein